MEAVRASADALGEQELVKVIKSVEEIFTLTDEGTNYAKDGLPERRLLQALGSGKPMAELKDPAIKIGLGWLRKKGWAVIQAGEIKPVGSAPKGKDEEILESLLAGPKNSAVLDENGLAALKSRGLVVSSKTKSWHYEITNRSQEKVLHHTTWVQLLSWRCPRSLPI